MKRNLTISLTTTIALTMILGLLFAACSQPTPSPSPKATASPSPSATPAPTTSTPTAAAKPFELKFSHYNATNHAIHVGVAVPFAQEVEKRSGGRIKVTVYPAEQLGKAKDHYDMTVTGGTDIAYVLPTYTPGRFPLFDVGSIPTMVTPSGQIGAKAMTALGKQGFFDKEFSEVRLLGMAMTSPMRLAFVKKQPQKVEDFKGIKIRTSGGYNTPAYEALGMTAVALGSPETYEALQKGVVEGVCVPTSSWVSQKYIEVLKYLIVNPPLATNASLIAMNKASWAKLPADLQKIVADVGELAGVWFGKTYDDQDEEAIPQLKKVNATIYSLTPEANKAVRNTVAPVNEKWIAEMEAKGLPGKKAVAEYIAQVEKLAQSK